ncbi:class I SAM-dependent methyltransferase [bacterium]|nr:class I SAM-dependent methyltransferase [bacterium]
MSDQLPTVYRWLVSEFSEESRRAEVARLSPFLALHVKPGMRVLDLCAGTGAFALELERLGALVVAVDACAEMIARGKAQAEQHGSHTVFKQADVLEDDLGGNYDAVTFLGDSIADFPPAQFSRLVERLPGWLAPEGRLLVHYEDGFFPFIAAQRPREYVQQYDPVLLTCILSQYLSEQGAYVETYRNEATGEECEYYHYLYTPPLVEALVGGRLSLMERKSVSDSAWLDVYAREARS